MNLNQLKEIAQKKKGRDVPCDALESALEIIEQASKVTRFETTTQEVGIDIEQRIKEIEGKAAMELDHTDIYIFGEREVAKQALEVINHLQSEVERYKSLWEANAAESEEIIAELKGKDEWQDISSAPKFEQVLVFYRNCFDNPRIVIARYLPEGTECQCSDDCGCRYDDEKDIYVQEGWYEQIDNWGDYSEVALCEGEPTHWKHLPKPPKQNH